MKLTLVTAALLIVATANAAPPPLAHETVSSGGGARTYWLYVPPQAATAPAPLLVLLHGSGHDGKILLEHWRALAEKEGIVLAGPDASVKDLWQFPLDGPNFLRDVVEAVKTKAQVDPKRIYLFGHSAGAMFASQMSMIESEYFAATVANAGGFPPNNVDITTYATRKIPMLLIVGQRDHPTVPIARSTRDTLQQRGFPVEFNEIMRGTHDYYGRSREINEMAWRFLVTRTSLLVPRTSYLAPNTAAEVNWDSRPR
jgi:poly(3-hydroxybutyrate) depolymerase